MPDLKVDREMETGIMRLWSWTSAHAIMIVYDESKLPNTCELHTVQACSSMQQLGQTLGACCEICTSCREYGRQAVEGI